MDEFELELERIREFVGKANSSRLARQRDADGARILVYDEYRRG